MYLPFFSSQSQFCCSCSTPHLHPFLSLNKQISEFDLGTVECSSWHGEPDPWAFQQHSLCTADIPGTRGSSYRRSLYLSSCLVCLSFTTPGGGNKLQRCLFCLPCYFIHIYPPCPFLLIFSFLLFEIFDHCPFFCLPFSIVCQRHPCTCGKSSTLIQTWLSFLFGQLTGRQGVWVLDGICNGLAICMSCTRISRTLLV